MSEKNPQHLSGRFVLLVFVCMAGFIYWKASDSGSPSVAPATEHSSSPTSIEQLSDRIHGIAKNNEAIEVVLRFEKVWSEDTALYGFASEANRIAAGIQKYFPIDKPKLRFSYEVPVTDKFGNVAFARVFAVSYRTEDIRRINYAGDNFPQQLFLSLSEATVYPHPIGRRLLVAYCKSDVASVEFCRREHGG